MMKTSSSSSSSGMMKNRRMSMSKSKSMIMSILAVVIVSVFSNMQSARAEWGVKPECTFFLQMAFLQDFSDSSRDDRVVIGNQLVALLDNMDATYPNDHAFASFVDKPIEPLGYPYQGPWFEGDWCYNLTNSFEFGGTNEESVDILVSGGPGGGADFAENQLGAMLDFVRGPTAMWNDAASLPDGTPIKRVLVVSTDSIYHIAGDGQAVSPGMLPNNGDGETNCREEDYPTIEQVRTAIEDREVYTIFLIGDSSGPDVKATYEELLDTLGTPGNVYTVNADGSNVLDIMEMALEDMADDVCSQTVDVVFSQDVTASYDDNLSEFQNGMDAFMQKVDDFFYVPRFGVTSFADKPFRPFGDGPSGDYCFRVDQPLTEDQGAVQEAANDLYLVSGIDWRESQLDAMISSVLTPTVGWRLGDTDDGFELLRFVVLATDAGYHRKGDALKAGLELSVHPGQAITDSTCGEWDYPTVTQLATALLALDVHPIFVPTTDIKSIYTNLNKELFDDYGIMGDVVELKDFGTWPLATAKTIKSLSKKIVKARRLSMKNLPAN